MEKTKLLMRPSTSKKSRGLLLLIIAIFVVPFWGAWILFRHHVLLPRPVNHGQLLNPPLSFRDLPLTDSVGAPLAKSVWSGKWAMLYVAPTVCGEDCFRHLYQMRQIRLALGADSDRVNRLLLIQPQQYSAQLLTLLTHDYMGTVLAESPAIPPTTLLVRTVALQPGFLYVADPLGNIILAYSGQAAPMGILKDFKRLLSVSQIG